MKERIVLIGAGSAMFTRGMLNDLIDRNWACDLALVDIDAEALAVAEGLARKMIKAKSAPIRLTATTDRKKTLKDATVVISTIGVGGRRAWEQDVFIPRKYGINQPVGDSVMPGGTSRALRMIPAMVDIAEDVLALAPNTLLFNYANPMGPICRAVRKATGAEAVGLCHGVNHVSKYLADMLDVSHGDLEYTAVGMNHLTWFSEVAVKGESVMSKLQTIACEQIAKARDLQRLGVQFWEEGSAKKSQTVEDANPFSWHLLKSFGAFPAAMDRHVTEFFPQFFADGKYYGKTLGMDAYSFEDCIAYGDKVFDEMKDLALSEKPLPEDYFEHLSGEHEQVIDIVESIRTDAGQVYSANLPNAGQVPNLPAGAIIESPARAIKDGLIPIKQEPLTEALAGTLATRLRWVEVVAEAALEGSLEKFVEALILDGAVGSLETAEKMAAELVQAQADYLPQFSKA